MSLQNSTKIEQVKVCLVKGADGSGIASIEKTGTSGLVDTYTITLDDGAKFTFTVTNGSNIASIEKTSTSGLTDTYTVTLTDGTTTTFEVTNGRGIVSIAKTSSAGLVDTYTITYNDGTTSTFDVTNSNGGKWTTPVNCAIGDTTKTISNASIQTTSVIEYYSENASGTPLNINTMVVTNGKAVLNFDALTEATSIRLHVINL
jgi:hypothetical protein